MLATEIAHQALTSCDRRAIARSTRALTYRQLAVAAGQCAAAWRRFAGHPVGVAMSSPVEFAIAAVALDTVGAKAYFAGSRGVSELAELSQRFAWLATIDAGEVQRALTGDEVAIASAEPAGGVTILTSGTTGQPKAVNHSWESLARPVRRSDAYYGTCWMTIYPLHLYAGMQVMLQAFLNGATLAIPESSDPAHVIACLRDQGVTHGTGTPTFWRHLLCLGSREGLKGARLQQITLGGEVIEQEILDQLAAVFPGTRIAHIYASSELGRIFTVTDGREGFPASYLDSPPENGAALKIVDGQLFARSSNAMKGYEDRQAALDEWGFFPTGDLVKVRGDRVVFVGRANDIINVGGAKVSPLEVERVIRAVPGVADAVVYPKSSSLVGSLVATDISILAGWEPESVCAAVRNAAREQLRPHQIPRFLRVVDAVQTNEALKTVRQGRVNE